MSPDAIIEKIRKLLRMKRGGTPAEIETALAMAAELARKHNIDLASVDPDVEQERPMTHEDILQSTRIQWECKYAGLVCAHFFNVELLLNQVSKTSYKGWGGHGLRGHSDLRIVFIGTAWDIQIARYIYGFLVQHFRHCWRTRRGRCRNRQAYLYGMYHGVCTKLQEARQAAVEGEGLILLRRGVTRRRDYLQRVFGETKEHKTTPDGDAHAAQMAGYLEGRNTNVRTGLSGNRQATPLLGGGQ